jgi:beta-glucosidase
VVLAVGFDPESESEGSDRTFQLPPGQDELIQEIAALNKNTIVVVTAGGSASMPWLNSVPALLHAWYPGQEGGTALARILFGETNPSGHLPATFEKRWEDNPVHDSYYPTPGTNKIEYKEGVFVGYRGYEHNKVQPQFPFGFGLSYTTFKYANLQATPTTISFDVTNTGKREGAAVPQVYIGDTHASIPRPPKELKGFAKVSLKPGETRHITIPLNDRSFQYYDVSAKQWKASTGAYDVMVGSSSADIALRGTVTR